MGKERSTEFDVIASCREAAEDVIDLWKTAVKKAKISLDQGGGDATAINAGLKASEKLLAYAYGNPSQKIELAGTIHNRTSIDVTKLSTEVLRQIRDARLKPDEEES